MAEMKKAQSKKGGGFDHLFLVRLIEKFVGAMRSVLTPKLLDFFTRLLTLLGHYCIYIVSVLAFLFGIIGAIRLGSGSFTFFLQALGFAIGILIVQYIAKKFSHAGETLIENNSSRLSSSAFLDCLGLLALIGGIAAFLYCLYEAIKLPSLWYLLYGIASFILLEFVALVALNPRTITVEVVDETSAGEEAIGIMTLFIKKVMRLIPILFGVGIIAVTVMLFINALGLFSEARLNLAADRSLKFYVLLIKIGLLPFLSYIFFVFAYLCIDVIRAILSIPKKLDDLRR